MRTYRARLSLLLALAVLAYGAAASVDVFLPAFSLPEEAHRHSHQGDSSYCGFVHQAPDFQALYSLPFLDTFERPEVTGEIPVIRVTAEETSPLVSYSFDLYRFRAPPEPNG